jgi:acyl-CoA synthetase (AMP-forming)/AMP-acid ligase II
LALDAFRRDGWLRTGDLGYLDSDGNLYITGRVKDVLVTRGVSTDPHRVEWAAASVPGVREGGVVAFTRPGPETEEVVVVAECANRALRGLRQLKQRLGPRAPSARDLAMQAGMATSW